jgi:hypothetical protein
MRTIETDRAIVEIIAWPEDKPWQGRYKTSSQIERGICTLVLSPEVFHDEAKANVAYRRFMKKIEKEGHTVGKIYYLWLQGESDAIGGTTGEAYAAMMTDFKNAMKAEIGFEVFGIIKVGYFCGTVSWMRPMIDKESGLLADEAIMEAQERLVREDPDFVMLTRVCPAMSLDDKWINPFAEGHYNNAAMAVIGTEVGEALGEILASRTEA